MFFLYMRPFISSEGKGGFFFHYLFICMTLDMTVCRVFLALKADFTCFSLVNISRDKRGRVECVFACECVSSWGSCSLCSVKFGLTDVSILSDLIVHSGKKALLVRLNNHKGASSNWSETGVIIKGRRIQMPYDWCEAFDITAMKS